MKTCFVTGAGTELGKTHVACALLRVARALGSRVDALKPIASGLSEADLEESDPGRLLAAMGRQATREAVEAMCPWRFTAPLAPPQAAALEGKELDPQAIAAFCRARVAARGSDLLLIEGAGGLMSPIAERFTCLDLIAALDLPSLFVTGSYLGAVSHTLSGLELMRHKGLAVEALVISESADGVGAEETAGMIRWFRQDLPIVIAPRGGSEDWAAALTAKLGLS